MNYGGTLTQVLVPGKGGSLDDLVLGFDSIAGYLQKDNPYIGALIGRYGNRIAKAQFTLHGQVYRLGANDHGNSLHGGWKGFDKKLWTALPAITDSSAALTLAYDSPDGEEGYPGKLHAEVTYELLANNALQLTYTATTDKETPVNLTNHTYFNLSGGREHQILDHVVTLYADQYTAVNAALIPTGELPAVRGTPMDFTTGKPVGRDISLVPGGYDHNFVLRKSGPGPQLAARVVDPGSGRVLEMYTTEGGVQFYSGNFLDGKFKNRDGKPINQHTALCLETQHFPDSPNKPNFPTTILKPGDAYHSVTVYQVTLK